MERNERLEDIERQINEWTWNTLSWLPDDCDEGYPEDPYNYQINETMQKALDKVKELTVECIKKHDNMLSLVNPPTEAAYLIWEQIEEQVCKLGRYGQTDTASREAFMFAVDKFYV